jgi:hypothetical protein
MQVQELFALVFIVGMFAGVFVIFLAMRQRAQLREMEHRERMAMIERGQVPTEPLAPGSRLTGTTGRAAVTSARFMSLGIIVIAVGLGLMTIVSIAGGSPGAGIGVGGAIAILGVALIVNSLVSANTVSDAPPPRPRDDLR